MREEGSQALQITRQIGSQIMAGRKIGVSAGLIQNKKLAFGCD
jgi:hypothetical protein